MEQRHKYEYDVDLQDENAATKVVRMVGSGRRVLEIGAGPGSITRLLKEHGNCRVTAVERDPTAIPRLAPFCENVYQVDLNDGDWISQVCADHTFQVAVAADVLEHLYDPWATLVAMKQCLQDDGCIVISLPHIAHNAVISCLIDGDFEYRDWGLLDRTHIRFFSIKNIQRLIEQAGLKIIEAEFVVRSPEQTELVDHWRRLSADSKRALADNRHGAVYQVVLKAVRETSPGHGLTLASLPVPPPGLGLAPGATLTTRIVALLKAGARPFLSLKMQTRILRILSRIGLKI